MNTHQSDSATPGKLSRAPSIFIGHGSPMNAIEENDFTRSLRTLGKRIPKPDAILCVSAHWLSAGTWVTHMKKPKTIHDFYGFPAELEAMEYPAPGSPETAERIRDLIDDPSIQIDDAAWGLDHGSWSILSHLYPQADVPVVQLSIDMAEEPKFHFELGEKLRALREKNILILGSGNIVHNLRKIQWNGPPSPWAVEFDEWTKKKIEARDFEPLYTQVSDTEAARFSVPTLDHYLPLLYVLGASDAQDTMKFEYEGIEHGSLSMRAVSFGL